jgi:hypothetical protein
VSPDRAPSIYEIGSSRLILLSWVDATAKLGIAFGHLIFPCNVCLMCRVPIAVLLFVASFTAVLRAQSTSASLAGRVTDASKARIAGAKVVAINAGTNVSDGATTNAAGEYYLRSLG